MRDVEAPRGREVRREGEAEETALAGAGVEARAEIEERHREHLPAAHDADLPALLDDEEAPTTVAGMGDEQRPVEAGGHRLEPDGQAGATRRRPPSGAGRGLLRAERDRRRLAARPVGREELEIAHQQHDGESRKDKSQGQLQHALQIERPGVHGGMVNRVGHRTPAETGGRPADPGEAARWS